MSCSIIDQAIANADRYWSDAMDFARKADTPSPAGVMAMGSGGGLSRLFNVNANDQLARSQFQHYSGWVYSCINIAANTIAGQSICAAVRTRAKSSRRAFLSKAIVPKAFEPLSDELELVRDHPVIKTMRRPNPLMVQHQFIHISSVMYDLTGRMYWWIKRSRGQASIWPLPASWVTPEMSDKGDVLYYRLRPASGAEEYQIPPSEIASIYQPDPSNPGAAFSTMQAAARPVLADEQLQETHRRHFQAPHNPFVITIGKMPDKPGMPGSGERMSLTREQRSRIEAMVMQMWAGVVNSNKPIVVDDIIEKVEQIGPRQKDMGYGESMKMLKERITQVYSVNPIVMGQIESANRASAVEAMRNFLTVNVNPKIELFSEWLTAVVAPLFAAKNEELYLWITPGKPVDPESDRADNELLMKFGCKRINELRACYDLPPLNDILGNKVLIPSGYTLVDEESLEEAAQEEEPADEVAEEQDDAETAGEPDAKDYERRYICFSKLMGRDEVAQLWGRQYDHFAELLSKDINAFMDSELETAVKRLLYGSGMSIHDTLIDEQAWCDGIKEICRQHLYDAALAGAALERELTVRRTATWETKDPLTFTANVIAAIQGFLNNLFSMSFWNDLANGIKDAIQQVIFGGVVDGKSAAEVADEIRDVLPANSQHQAENIAHTELTGALNAGQHAMQIDLADNGIILGKEWLATLDGRVRPEHRAAHGQRKLVNQPFMIGGHPAKHPGDPDLPASLRCRCRCSMLSITMDSPPAAEDVDG